MSKSFDSGQIIRTLQQAWRDDFGGGATTSPTVNSNWNVTNGGTIQVGTPSGILPTGTTSGVGSGMSVNIDGSSNLVISTGTTASQATYIQTTQAFTIPLRVTFNMKADRKIINSDFYIELVNTTGDMYASFYYTSTNTTVFSSMCANTGQNTQNVNSISTVSSITSGNTIAFEVFPDSIELSCINYNQSEWSHVSVTQRLPDPQQQYYIRFRVVNGSTSPMSSTTYTIDHITVEDMTGFHTKITGGRGSTAGSLAIPAYVTNGSSIGYSSVSVSNSVPVMPASSANYWYSNATLGAGGSVAGSFYGTYTIYKYFSAFAASDQAGTIYIDMKIGSVTVQGIQSATIPTGGGVASISVPCWPYASTGLPSYAARYVNGSTGQTAFYIASNYVGS